MTQVFLGIYDWLKRHRWCGAAMVVAVMAAAAVLGLRLDKEEDIAKFLPRDAATEQQNAIYEQLSDRDVIAVVLSPASDSASAEPEGWMLQAQEAMDALGEKLAAVEGIEDVQTVVDEVRIMEMTQWLQEHYALLATDADYQRIDSLLAQPDYVERCLASDKQQLMLPTAAAFSQTLPHDPLQLFTPILGRLRGLRQQGGIEVVDGYLFTPDGQHALMTMRSSHGGSETSANAALAASIDSAIAQVQSEFPAVRASAVGAPVIAVTNAQQIKRDSLLAIIIALVLIVALLVWHYRRVMPIVWIVASIAAGWLLALGAMSCMRPSVSIIVLGMGSIILGIAVNYPLHFIDHLPEVPSVREALREMVPPLLIGNITTVAAFLCLVWLDAAAMRDLGWMGALTLVGTILVVLVVLPQVVKKGNKPQRNLNVNASWMELRTARQRRVTLIVVTLITIVLGVLGWRTSFDSDLSHINYMTSEQREGLQLLSQAQPASEGCIYAAVERGTLDEALAASDSLLTIVGPVVDSVSTITSIVPSHAEQQRRLAMAREFWAAHDGAGLVARLRQAAVNQGFKADAFAPFCAMVMGETQPVDAEQWQEVIDVMGQGYVLSDTAGMVTVVNRVYAHNVDDTRETLRQAGAVAFTTSDIGNQLVNTLNDSFNYIGWVCSIVVFFFLWLSFGSIELALLSFLPLAVSWLWILGLMNLMGVQFNIVNIILATFIFGQGDDYTIFITDGLINEHATGRKLLRSYKSTVALSALIMFIGIGTLIVARHPALRSLAQVTIIGMATVVVMAYLLPPLVFHWITRHKGQVREVPLTLKRLARSTVALVAFAALMFLALTPFTWLYFKLRRPTEERRTRFHTMIKRISGWAIRHVPGVKFGGVRNAVGEDFKRPAVLISNHQSHLDLMCLLQLTPKMVFLTNDWAWRNPLYSLLIHKAEFIPVSDGIEANLPRLRELYNRGYSIAIFPEGTRTPDRDIHRFHKGAFYLARALGADVLPVLIHGGADVLPKRDFMLREGRVDVEVCRRIPSSHLLDDDRANARVIRQQMIAQYDHLSREIETVDYWASWVKHQYLYKGRDVEKACNTLLRNTGNCAQQVREATAGHLVGDTIDITDNGQGELALLTALTHPQLNVRAHLTSPTGREIALHLAHVPQNLTFTTA